jgi:hypothetical protein
MKILSRLKRFPKLLSSPPFLNTCYFIASFPQPRSLSQLDNSPVFGSTSQRRQSRHGTHRLPYVRLPKPPNHYTFTLKMATEMSA